MAEEYVSELDKLFDEDNDENIILTDDSGRKLEFQQIALIPLDEEVYAILSPVEKVEGLEEDEAFVFLVGETEDEEFIEICKDEKIIQRVFDEYYKLVENA